MKRIVLAAFSLLVTGLAVAQPFRVPPRRTVAQLGTCTIGKPSIVAVTDGLTTSDCSTGGGSHDVICTCKDGDWDAGGVGPQGPAGAAASVTVGSTVTGAAGTQAAVSNSGTSSTAVLDFQIPRGDTGATGAQGPAGATGPQGPTGATGAPGADGLPRGVQDEGLDLTVRPKLNFIGTGVTCFDNSGASRTDCSIPIPVHSALSGLGADDHPQYPLSAGRSGGQTLTGGTASGESLLFQSTSNSTNGQVRLECPSYIAGCYGVGLYVDKSGTIAGLQVRQAGGTALTDVTARNFVSYSGSSPIVALGYGVAVNMRADQLACWNSDSSTLFGGSSDTCLARDSPGIVSAVNKTGGAVALKSGKSITVAQTLSIADNGVGASRASGTLTPTASFVKCSCSDPDGCDIQVSETGAIDGQMLRIVNVGANVCGFSDVTGVTETSGAVDLGAWDSIAFLYVTDRWVQIARSDN